MKIHWRTDGDPNGIPLILVNGLFADLHSWDNAMPFLQDFHVLRYDGRGQGESDQPQGPYLLDHLINDLHQAMDEAQWPATWMVGLSNGGTIVLEAARRYPDKVNGIVAADCYNRLSPLMKLKVNSWLEAHKIGGPTHRFDIAAPWIWSEAILKAHPEMVAFYRDKAAERQDHIAQALLEGALEHDVPIDQINAPCLMLAGEEDVFTPPFTMNAMAQAMPRGQFMTVPGAHASLLEHPTIFRDTIIPYIEEHHVG